MKIVRHLPRMLYLLGWILAGLALVEGVSAGLCWFLWSRASTGRLIWHPSVATMGASWRALSSGTDNDIGGVPIFSPASGAVRDATGAKLNPQFPDPAHACGAAYGESLVLGYEVPANAGWVEQLSRLLGCRIANYAVNYYSPDQAYRRFRQNQGHITSFVILGIDPSTIMDVVSQYTALIGRPLGPYALKGRYLLGNEGRLRWLPRPPLGIDQFSALHRAPARVLTYEYFMPDTRDGPVTPRFPYSLTLARVARSARVRRWLTGRPEWSGFYAADHPSGALPLLEAICRAFADDATGRGERPLIVMLPLAESFRTRQKWQQFEYSPLVADLRARGITVMDLGPVMLAALGGRSFCELFVDRHNCRGHYSVFGNTIVANAMAAELLQLKIPRRQQLPAGRGRAPRRNQPEAGLGG